MLRALRHVRHRGLVAEHKAAGSARDRMGIKPLYFHLRGGELISLGTENHIRPPGIKRELDFTGCITISR